MGTAQADLELVRRVQAGEKRAFDLLVVKYQHKIVSLSMRYVHDADAAQDVAQETFIKAYRGLKNFRGDAAFYTWLYRIGINCAKNYLVSMSRRMPLTDIDAQDAEQFAGVEALKENATPEREMHRDELQQAIIDTVDALPADLRLAIQLREMDGLSYEEIAQTMECPIGTVRSRIFRARETIESVIRPMLKAQDDNSGEQ